MDSKPLRILLQTTTPAHPDDWSIDSVSLLRRQLESPRFQDRPVFVTARNREAPPSGSDPVLAEIDRSDFDELWLFGLDTGKGITAAECAAIGRFRRRGGGLVTARDHQDMGASLCDLGGVGAANHFHTRNPEPDESRRRPDDWETTTISWPNYHSGRNGDFQRIEAVEPVHALLRDPEDARRTLEFFPAHPHEGAVSAPPGDESARVIAVGRSAASGRPFNLIVAFERGRDGGGNLLGRAVAHSSFHHFADYNWDTREPAPSFVTEPEGTGMASNERARADIRAYVANLARWLAPDSK
ncbi:MAG TPA: hypothetical protein VGL03_15600 [Thermoanaerobaculia bacterium]|jgi:hypothetical protein